MALSAVVCARLLLDGLTTVSDFSDFKEDQFYFAFKNMRTFIPGVQAVQEQRDQADNNSILVHAVAAIPPVAPTLVSAKCGLRLKIASVASHYYIFICRDVKASNMNYTNVLKDFHTEYESVIALSDETKSSAPALSKNNSQLKWIDSFRDCLFRTYGLRKTPLLYVIRDDVAPPDELEDPLVNGKACYGSYGSIIDELIARLTHADPLYKSDNASVYSMMEEATRGTIYASTVKPYSRKKDGRSAWKSMVSSHAGTDKWEQLQKDRSKFMMNTKWNVHNFSLEKFTGIHRSSYISLQEAAAHINFQLPTENTRVGYLIDNIINADPNLRAAISSVRIDTNGMRSNFETAVAFLLPVDPYSKHQNRNKDKNVNVSDANDLQNKSTSKIGVDFRWHKPDEYKTLTKGQKSELYEWQRSKEGKAATHQQRASTGFKSKPSAKKKLQSKVAALEAALKEQNSEPTLEELTACISAAQSTKGTPKTAAVATEEVNSHVAAVLALKGILKRKRATALSE